MIWFDFKASIDYPINNKPVDCAPLSEPCFFYEITIKLDENATIKESNSPYPSIDDSTSIKEINKYNFTLNPQDVIQIGFEGNKKFNQYSEGVKTTISEISFKAGIKNNIINTNENSFIKSFQNNEKGSIKYNPKSNKYEKIMTVANYGVINLKTDKGFIFTDIVNAISLKKNYDYIQTISDSFHPDILFYAIRIDNMSRNYERVYKKLQNVFADLGGLFNSFLLIGSILIVQFNKIRFDYDLINKVFQIQTEIINELKSKPPIIEDISSSRLPIKNNSNNIQESNKVTKDSHRQKELDLFNNKNSTVELKRSHILSVKEMKNKSQQDLNQNKYFKSIENNKNKVENNHEDTAKNNNTKEFVNKYNNNLLFKKPLKYSKSDFFMTFICCQKLKNPSLIAKETIFNQAQAQIYDDMDIINYISLFERFEKLISILLNEYQAISFNFMQNRSLSGLQTNRISEESITKVLDYYRCQIKNSGTSLIDDRLIKAFYPSFLQLIQIDNKAE